MNAMRSSMSNSARLLRTDALTTATISSSNMPLAREMMSTCPRVTGAEEQGQTGMRGSGAMDADQGVAVAAFVVQGQVERERRPSVALGHGHRPGRQDGGEGLRQPARERVRQP